MSAFGGKADIAIQRLRSAFDPKRTSAPRGAHRRNKAIASGSLDELSQSDCNPHYILDEGSLR